MAQGNKNVYYDSIDWKPNVTVAQGLKSFTTTATLTTETTTGVITPSSGVNPNNLYSLVVKRGIQNTAGDLTVKVYNVDTVNTTNTTTDVLHSTHTVETTSGATTTRDFLVRGMFAGTQGKVKLGFVFATDDAGKAVDVNYKIIRL